MSTVGRSRVLEEKGIRLSILGNLFMALLGLFFSLLSKSEVVFLDGVFSFINFIIALLSLKVIKSFHRKESCHKPHSYVILESFISLTKGVLMAAICIFVVVSSISFILQGGHTISSQSVLWYAIVATLACLMMAFKQREIAHLSRSSLISVDAKSWFVDSLFSSAVVGAFATVIWLEQTSLEKFTPYADPMIALVLALVAIPIPIEIIRKSLPRVLVR